MGRRDYKLWTYHCPDGETHLIDRKGSPKAGDRFRDIDGSEWEICYVEEGPRVRNARLEPVFDRKRFLQDDSKLPH